MKTMCPISGVVQFLIVVVTLLLVCHGLVANALTIVFKPNNVTIHMHDTVHVEYTITDVSLDTGGDNSEFLIYSESPGIAELDKEIVIIDPSPNLAGSFNLTGNFLGQTVIACKNRRTNETAQGQLDVVVIREVRVIDKIFTASTATLVAIIYINFGCVVKWGELKNILKRPIGPVIGFCGQFIVMPLLSYGLGAILFPESPEMRLGMFFTGVSPAGGASNIWTAILDGNLELSIIMTTISTIAAFGMMPLWIFSLGRIIFEQGNLEVPYTQILTYVLALVIPLGIGYLITRYLKKVGKFLARILKGFSSLLILFIIIFAIVTNLYLFSLFSWKIVLAGMGLPYLGFIIGYITAKVLKQPPPDSLAIAIETGIQNTGIAIFLLRFSLPQPQADLTTVAPVSVAIMTPFPLLFLFIYKKIKERYMQKKKLDDTEAEVSPGIPDNNFNVFENGFGDKLANKPMTIS